MKMFEGDIKKKKMRNLKNTNIPKRYKSTVINIQTQDHSDNAFVNNCARVRLISNAIFNAGPKIDSYIPLGM